MKLYWISDAGNMFDFLTNTKTVSVEGFDFNRKINTLSTAGYDGATYISSQIPQRVIKLNLKLFSSNESERERLVFSLGSSGTLYKDEVKIYGHINKISYNYTVENSDNIQVEIVCPDPYFKKIQSSQQVIAAVMPRFSFPFTFHGEFKFGERNNVAVENFVNSAAVTVYPIIEFTAISTLENPSIMNVNTYEKMKVNVRINAGEKVVINTGIGQKSIKKISGNLESDIFDLIDPEFVFFGLYNGDNYLKYDADMNVGGLKTTLKWENVFTGL